jgi:gliding motility-associated-like protein
LFLDVNGLSCSNQPSLTATINPTATCSPQTVTLTANPSYTNSSSSYTWSAPASGGLAAPAITGSVVTANPTASTTYTLAYSDNNTCAGFPVTAAVSITFTTPPAVSVSPSVSTICAGQSQVLSASGAGPFNWVASSGLFPVAAANVTVSPAVTTTYTVKSGVGSCTTSAVAIVNVSSASPITITPSSSTICVGQSVSLTSSGSGPYTWTASSGTNPLGAANVTVSPTSTTTYTVISGIGTCTTSATATVSVPPPIQVTVTPTFSAICVGQSVALSATGSGPFVWTASNGTNPTSAANVTVSPNSTTTYTVISGTGSCTTSAVSTISISLTPSIAITPSLSTICLGQSQVLSSSGAGPFTWSASAGATPPAAANVTVTPTTTTTYTVLSGSGTCTASAVATVSLSIPIATTVTPAQSSICSGQSQTLTASGAGPFTWIASNGPNPISSATIVVTPTITTTYTVIEGSGTCSSSAIVSVTIVNTPTMTISPTNTIICNGQSASLSVIGSAGPFAWTASSGANPPPTGAVNVTPTITTTYTVLSGIGTCTSLAAASVSVSPAITVSITPSNTIICNGSSASLSASGATSYTWFPSLSNSVTLVVSPTSTSIYSVVGTNGVCVNSATATVNVTSVATSVNSSSPFYCIGASPVNLTASGATTYSWSPANNLNSTLGAVVTATPLASIVYSVTGTTGNCSSTQTIAISVPPQTAITSTTSNSIICVGAITPTLTAFGASTYTWLPFSTSSASLTVNPTITTSYTVLGQTSAGCLTLPSIVTVSVLPTINPTLSASSSTLCLTKTVSIIANPTTSGLTYSWQPASAILGASNTFSIIAQPTTTSVVIYTVTISNGFCLGTNTVQLQAFVAPDANFITLNNDTICVGGCVTFSSTSTGSLPMTYSWLYEGGVGTSSVGATPEACYPSAGNFSVTLIASNGCSADTTVKSNFITVYDMPIIVAYGDTTINIGESTEIFVTGGLSYYWYPNNSSIACITCSNTTVQPTVSTNYIVVGSNSQYCQAQDTVKIIVDVNCGDFFIPNVFSPNDDGLNDFINVHGRCITTYNLQIFSRWGEKVFETSNLENSWDGTYKGKKMDTGVFVYKADGVSIDGKSFKFKGNITLIR